MTVSRYGVVPDPGRPFGVAAAAVPGAAKNAAVAPAPPRTAMPRTWRRERSLTGAAPASATGTPAVAADLGSIGGLDADIGPPRTGRRRSAGDGGGTVAASSPPPGGPP